MRNAKMLLLTLLMGMLVLAGCGKSKAAMPGITAFAAKQMMNRLIR